PEHESLRSSARSESALGWSSEWPYPSARVYARARGLRASWGWGPSERSKEVCATRDHPRSGGSGFLMVWSGEGGAAGGGSLSGLGGASESRRSGVKFGRRGVSSGGPDP